MQSRTLGRSCVKISPLILGGNVFGWTTDEATSFSILDAFLDAGYTTIDTADVYSIWVPGHVGGESESMIGKWLKARGNRDRVVIASKVGEQMPAQQRGLSASHIIHAVEASLLRLQTDYIDLYQAHLDDRAIPLEETLEAFHKLTQAGKIRAIGASHYEPDRLAEALSISNDSGFIRYDSVQPRYNLFDRFEFEGKLQDLCIAGDVSVLCYSTLAKGFLTGAYRLEQKGPHTEWSSIAQQRYINERGWRILAELDAIAAEHTATVAEIALAWLMCQPGVSALIIGVMSVTQLEELIACMRIKLDISQVNRLRTASSSVP